MKWQWRDLQLGIGKVKIVGKNSYCHFVIYSSYHSVISNLPLIQNSEALVYGMNTPLTKKCHVQFVEIANLEHVELVNEVFLELNNEKKI